MTNSISSVIGDIFILMSSVEEYKDHTIGYLNERLFPSLSRGDFVFVNDENGNPMCFVSWVFLSRNNFNKIEERNLYNDIPYDYCEDKGDILFITEFVNSGKGVLSSAKKIYKHIKSVYPDFSGSIYGFRSIKNRKQCFKRGQ